jgi:replication factor A1
LRPRIDLFEEKRGRPSGRSNEQYTYLKSIVSLAHYHDVDPTQLADAFYEALETSSSNCGRLEIACREENQESATFLILKEGRVVWQSTIKLDSLRNPDIRQNIETLSIPYNLKKKKHNISQKIGNLRLGMKGISVRGKIIEVTPPRTVKTRFGTYADVSNVMVADDTGSVRLSLWNGQIDQFKTGDYIECLACTVRSYGGALQLQLGRKGTLSILNATKNAEWTQAPQIS